VRSAIDARGFPRPRDRALRIALVYFLAAVVWIALSDRILVSIVSDPVLIGRWSTAKGIFFVVATATLLYIAVRRQLRTVVDEHDRGNRAEEALNESRVRLRALTEQVSDGIFLHDEQGRFVDVNSQACLSLGYTREELLQLSVHHIEQKLDLEGAQELWSRVRAGAARTIIGSQRRKDGTSFPVEVRVSCCEVGGRVLFIAVARDITERERAVAALRESEERFRQLVETIREVFWITDPSMDRVYYVSPSYEEVWGRTRSSLYAAPRSWLEAIHPSDADQVSRAVENSRGTGILDVTYRIHRPDGGIRWIRDRGYPVRNAAGRIERIAGVAEDITERRLLEDQFLRAQRMDAVGSLSSGVAHDLNNILAPILMAATVVKEELRDPRERHLLEMIEQGAQRGAGIVRQLLTFSRGADGERVPVQLRHLVKEMSSLIRETFPRAITLKTDLPKDLWSIPADPTQIHQVLMNLCVNARDAMPNGGTLTLRAENRRLPSDAADGPAGLPQGQYVVLTVADTGQGIPPDTIERIFDPFFTTKPSGKGTGLGLATVLSIVKGHFGTIQVESPPGRGSTFRVYLPAVSQSEPSEPAAAAPEVRTGNQESILVVDDEPAVCETLRRILERQGYRVLTARDGHEGLILVKDQRQRVQLVIADLMMPVMDGLALARAIRIAAPEVAVIGTSGMAIGDWRAEWAGAGVAEVLMKPFSPAQLTSAVGRRLPGPAPKG
jgi:PAS domain S-box-containing protein